MRESRVIPGLFGCQHRDPDPDQPPPDRQGWTGRLKPDAIWLVAVATFCRLLWRETRVVWSYLPGSFGHISLTPVA